MFVNIKIKKLIDQTNSIVPLNPDGEGASGKSGSEHQYREYTSKHTVYRCFFENCKFVSLSRDALKAHQNIHNDVEAVDEVGVIEDRGNLRFIDEGARARVPSQRQILRLMSEKLRGQLEETGLIEHLESLTELFQNLAGPDNDSGQTFDAVMCRVHENILKDRRITTKSPEWGICRDLLGVVNSLWHEPLTLIDVEGVAVST